MDKYEYKVRADEIKQLIAQGEYAQAAEIADTIDWRRVKSVMMLCTISDLYKINRRYEDARDMLLLAYERRPGGRTICYSLCELSIKMEEVVQAIEYYKEFVQVAPRDPGRYILQYKLYEAQEVSLEERIEVLEELKKRDYREKWAYELAYLYHRIGLATRCVEECDELILWFGDGKYVIKAMELKMLHQPLTAKQQELYDRRFEEADTYAENTEYTSEDNVENNAENNAENHTSYESTEDAAGDTKVIPDPMLGDTQVYVMSGELRREAEEEEGASDAYWNNEEEANWQAEEQPEESIPEEDANWQVEEQPQEEQSEEEFEYHVKTMDVGEYNTINLQAQLAEGLKEVLGEEYGNEAGERPQDAITRTIIAPMLEEDTEPENQEPAEDAVADSYSDVYDPVGADYEATDYEATDAEEFFTEESYIEESDVQEVYDTENPGLEEADFTESDVEEDIEPGDETVEEAEEIIEETEVFFGDTGEIQQPEAFLADDSAAELISQETYDEVGVEEFLSEEPASEEPTSEEISAEAFGSEEFLADDATGELREEPIAEEDITAEIVMEQMRRENSGETLESVMLAEPPKELASVLQQDSDGQLSLVMPDSEFVEKQITGQMSIEEILAEWERMKKENEEKRKEEVRQHVLQQTGDMFTEFEASVRDGLLEQIESGKISVDEAVAATDGADSSDEEEFSVDEALEKTVDEETAASDAEEDLEILDNLESDEYSEVEELEEIVDIIDRVTGEIDTEAVEFAVAEAEFNEEFYEAPVEEVLESYEFGEQEPEEIYEEAAEAFYEESDEESNEESYEAPVEEVLESYEFGEQEFEETVPNVIREEAPEEFSKQAQETLEDTIKEEFAYIGADTEDVEPNEVQEAPVAQESTSNEAEVSKVQETLEVEREQPKLRDLTKEEKELYAPFIQSRAGKEQLIRALDNVSMAAFTGNIIVTGESGVDTLGLAKSMIREVQLSDRNFAGKVAKISGEALNKKDVEQVIRSLKNGALIVEKASNMNSDTVNALYKSLQQETSGMIVVLEGSKRAMNRFLSQYEKLDECFTARVDVEPLSNDTLVAFGRQYAKEREYSIDEFGVLALHTRIEELQTSDHNVTVVEVKDIVDEAIAKASKKTLGHFMDVLLKRRFDADDMIVLGEKDFARY
ncbi:MAG: hypothetical protein IJ833_05140 [Lachnospiraceae bacterium]|nr:hypothetical protein [Lachnospiraceae bacterium]